MAQLEFEALARICKVIDRLKSKMSDMKHTRYQLTVFRCAIECKTGKAKMDVRRTGGLKDVQLGSSVRTVSNVGCETT